MPVIVRVSYIKALNICMWFLATKLESQPINLHSTKWKLIYKVSNKPFMDQRCNDAFLCSSPWSDCWATLCSIVSKYWQRCWACNRCIDCLLGLYLAASPSMSFYVAVSNAPLWLHWSYILFIEHILHRPFTLHVPAALPLIVWISSN